MDKCCSGFDSQKLEILASFLTREDSLSKEKYSFISFTNIDAKIQTIDIQTESKITLKYTP